MIGLVIPPPIQAQELAASFADLSIEQLLNESVSSVTKRMTRQVDAPAAISVLSNDDIQRSGATTIADALRMVPGLNVGAVNSGEFAISARGFSNIFSNKMLVLVDGRAVYNALFAGVFWDLQQPILEDLDRVEVIRGPGAAVWGANSMNGVINIVSRSARDTQGGLAYIGGGNIHESMAGGRYGGKIGDDIYYRIFASTQSTHTYTQPDGSSGENAWDSWHGGFRLDQYADASTHLTWQADATALEQETGDSDAYNINTLARLTYELSGKSSIELQAYYDRVYRNSPLRAKGLTDTFDVTAQHNFSLGQSHDITWGLGYRFIATTVKETNPLARVKTSQFDLNLFSLFLQDEWHMFNDKLTLTTGARLEHNDYTGFEIQPNLRVLFKPTEKQTLWAAVSRAVRTPSATEGMDVFSFVYGGPFVAPGFVPPAGVYVPVVVGNDSPSSEVLWAYEMGYRIQPHRKVSIDSSAFYNRYKGLINVGEISRFTPGLPVGIAERPFTNNLNAETYGGELAVTFSPSDAWRLTTSYSLLFADFHGSDMSIAEEQERFMPTHQVAIRSSYDFSPRTSLDVQVRYVDQIDTVPSYITADIRLLHHLTDNLDISLVAQNLFDDQHLEQRPQAVTMTSQVPRGFYAKITWRF